METQLNKPKAFKRITHCLFGIEQYDENATHCAFEEYVGGPTKAFRLMNLYKKAGQIVSGDRYSLISKQRTQESVFISLAKRDGFPDHHISAYLQF